MLEDCTNTDCVICEDTAKYKFVVEKIFNVGVEIDCVLAYGINTDC